MFFDLSISGFRKGTMCTQKARSPVAPGHHRGVELLLESECRSGEEGGGRGGGSGGVWRWRGYWLGFLLRTSVSTSLLLREYRAKITA